MGGPARRPGCSWHRSRRRGLAGPPEPLPAVQALSKRERVAGVPGPSCLGSRPLSAAWALSPLPGWAINREEMENRAALLNAPALTRTAGGRARGQMGPDHITVPWQGPNGGQGTGLGPTSGRGTQGRARVEIRSACQPQQPCRIAVDRMVAQPQRRSIGPRNSINAAAHSFGFSSCIKCVVSGKKS